MFGKIIGLSCSRCLFVASLSLACAGAGPLVAGPDPDIFDGRKQNTSQGAGDGVGAEAPQSSGGPEALAESTDGASAETSPVGPATSSGRDFGEVGELGEGSSAVHENEASTPASGDFAQNGGSKQSGESAGGGASGAAQESQGGSGGSPSGGEARDFETIGTIGIGGVTEAVDVNSSKGSSTPGDSAPGSSQPNPGPSGPGQPDPGTDGGASSPGTGSGSGDVGERLPSGL